MPQKVTKNRITEKDDEKEKGERIRKWILIETYLKVFVVFKDLFDTFVDMVFVFDLWQFSL